MNRVLVCVPVRRGLVVPTRFDTMRTVVVVGVVVLTFVGTVSKWRMIPTMMIPQYS
jgi:hypothetical protein